MKLKFLALYCLTHYFYEMKNYFQFMLEDQSISAKKIYLDFIVDLELNLICSFYSVVVSKVLHFEQMICYLVYNLVWLKMENSFYFYLSLMIEFISIMNLYCFYHHQNLYEYLSLNFEA